MATNKILPFAQDPGANVITDAEYAALTALLADGFLAGIAHSNQMNKVWRQSSVIAAGVAQFLADHQAVNIDDSLTAANISTYLSNALSAAGVFTTPAQFDNTTKVATTEFANRIGLNAGAVGILTTTQTLSAAAGGSSNYCGVNATPITLTLPSASSVKVGTRISFYNTGGQSGGVVTVAPQGADTISIPSASAASVALDFGDSLILERYGSGWFAVGGTAALWSRTTTGAFGASKASAGYQKLPSGLIIQWGTSGPVPASSTLNVTLPITFPTAFLQCVTCVLGGPSAGSTLGCSPVDASTIQITNGATSTPSARWFAIGH